MTTRRDFLKNGSLAMAGLLVGQHSVAGSFWNEPTLPSAAETLADYVCQRPAPDKRQFTSEAVEKAIRETKAQLKDPKLAWMFENCFPNTLDTTCEHKKRDGKPDTFVITGDVHDFANRSEFKAYVESQGGKVTGSVSKKTDYLVNNDTESTSSKNKKAKELGIPIISEDTFIEMFGR